MTIIRMIQPFTSALLISSVILISAARSEVTTTSLLNEMVDREALPRFPSSDFRLKQASSYNRASKTPDDEKGWFTNRDFNSNDRDKNFIRIDNRDGRKEWVLMDHKGAGAIVRTWMPWANDRKPDTDTIIRIYLDGAAEPVLQGNMLSLFDGSGLIPYPFAHESLRSAVSFFPIPYAKHCKITTSKAPFFYQFTYREYPQGTKVKTFSVEEFESAQPLAKSVGEKLIAPHGPDLGGDLTLTKTLATQEEAIIDLPAGPGSVREIAVKLGSYQKPAITRSVVLKMECDGKETIWCPVGDFFGSGIGLHPFRGFYRTVDEDGTMSCRWIMPYQKTARISLVNLGKDSVEATLAARTGDWAWDSQSMYFHADWKRQYPVPTRPFSDWNYITTSGRGVYVGDTLTVMNPVERWWGEGDEKIWVDGEDFPSIFGTGTEDYYAYSWGGRSTDFYEHPFHAQPRSNEYNKLNRKTARNEKDTSGYSTETRTRSLDTMPFGKSLQLDMEVWSWTECDMEFAVATYWYGLPGTTSNVEPSPDGATAPLTWPLSAKQGGNKKPAR